MIVIIIKKSDSKNMLPCFKIPTAKYKLRRQKKWLFLWLGKIYWVITLFNQDLRLDCTMEKKKEKKLEKRNKKYSLYLMSSIVENSFFNNIFTTQEAIKV